VVSVISDTMARLAGKPGATLAEPMQPLTETLAGVLLHAPALELGLDGGAAAELACDRNELAVFVGFDFAMRCVAIVLADPLADHCDAFRSAARSSARILATDDSARGE